jgi:hypothetical protein
MVRIIYVLLSALLIQACQSTTHNLGEQFESKNPVTVDSILTLINSENTLQDVQVEGVIQKSCMSEGCWLTIKDKTGNEILFNVAGKKFRIPMNSPGKNVIVLVDAKATLENLKGKESPKNEIAIKGLLFK